MSVLISKTPCVGDMNPLIRLARPLVRLVGKGPSVTTFSAASLEGAICAAGSEILENVRHGSKESDTRPFIVARAPTAWGIHVVGQMKTRAWRCAAAARFAAAEL